MFDKKLLLAKTSPLDQQSLSAKYASYTGHIGAVMRSAQIILDLLGDRILHQLGIEVSFSYFRNTAMLGAFLHDSGKANQHFQEMVYLKSEFITKSKDDKV